MSLFNKNYILDKLYQSKQIADIKARLVCKNVSPDDVVNDVFLNLLSMPDEKILSLLRRRSIYGYAVRCILNRASYCDRKAMDFVSIDGYWKYDEPYKEDKVDLKALPFYYRTLLEIYAEIGSVHVMSEDMGIPVGTLHNHIQHARKLYKKSLS